jgi:hypothetical protein
MGHVGMDSMQDAHATTIRTCFRTLRLVAMTLVALLGSAGPQAIAEESEAYSVEVSDVTAKVGDHAVMLATLRLRDGYRILEAYNNRVGQLSSFDDGVAFEHKVVPAKVENGTLVFAVGLQATKPGRHAINGVFRVGYIEGTDSMSMVSIRLIANVIGTD